jgi:NADH-quinone oxidoreductase subunit M
MSDNLLLTSLWLVPLIGLVTVLVLPKQAEHAVKWVSLGFTSATFVITLVVLAVFLSQGLENKSLRDRVVHNKLVAEGSGELTTVDEVGAESDLVVRRAWIPYFNIQYYVGVDGISLSLVVLTGLVSVLACVASWNIDKQVKGYFALYLLLCTSMIGVFISLDLFLFYVFFEVMLLPMYFLIAIWGGPRREYAAIKFLLYTLFGSVFILVAILILYFFQSSVQVEGFSGHSFDIVQLSRVASETSYYPRSIQWWVFILFFIGFIVKLPSFPFHTWLPDAHVEAPTPISMILAGILLKIGGYGLIRLAWPLAPAGAYDWSIWVAFLGVFSILYGALVAMAQTDFKKLVAYSSVSHMGYVTLGMAVMGIFAADGSRLDPRYYAYGVNGAMYMMLAHGITSVGMFFLVGVIYDRAHTRDLNKLGGLANIMPVYGAMSYIIFFGSMGLPGLCGFVAEVFVVLSAFNYSPVLAVMAAAAVILTAGYILWTIQRVFLGRNEAWKGLPDMDLREILIGVPLVVLTIAMGIVPQWLVLSWMSPSVDQMVRGVVAARELDAQLPRARPVALNTPQQRHDSRANRLSEGFYAEVAAWKQSTK